MAAADEPLEDRLDRLVRWHPTIARGGMSWGQLKDLAKRIAARRGLECRVHLKPWPWRGSVTMSFGALIIHVDQEQGLPARDAAWSAPQPAHEEARRRAAAQLAALAHEVGHVALGHYSLGERGVWFHQDGDSGDELEWEADAFSFVATRSPGTPIPSSILPQLRLL